MGSSATTHFDKKTRVMEGNYIELQQFDNKKLLKMYIFDLQWS